MHDGNDTLTDQFTLVARTDLKSSVPAVVKVKVIPVNDETPVLVNNTGLEAWAGSKVIITVDRLGKIILFKRLKCFALETLLHFWFRWTGKTGRRRFRISSAYFPVEWIAVLQKYQGTSGT